MPHYNRIILDYFSFLKEILQYSFIVNDEQLFNKFLTVVKQNIEGFPKDIQ